MRFPVDQPTLTAAVDVAESMLADGFAFIRPYSNSPCPRMEKLYSAARAFFERPAEEKEGNILPEDCGYRPAGVEYSTTPDMPDLLESYTASARTIDASAEQSSPYARTLHAAAMEVFDILEPIAEDVATALSRLLSGRSADLSGAFRRWSRLQINSACVGESPRGLINELHEDGHLLTIWSATAPGLELQIGSEFIPVDPIQGGFLIFPGEAARLLSGGVVKPMFHRVRRLPGIDSRLSSVLFADVDPLRCVPWGSNEVSASPDIGRWVLSHLTRSGLRGFGLE